MSIVNINTIDFPVWIFFLPLTCCISKWNNQKEKKKTPSTWFGCGTKKEPLEIRHYMLCLLPTPSIKYLHITSWLEHQTRYFTSRKRIIIINDIRNRDRSKKSKELWNKKDLKMKCNFTFFERWCLSSRFITFFSLNFYVKDLVWPSKMRLSFLLAWIGF